MVDGYAKIEPIINDLQYEISNIINKAGIRAQNRLKIQEAVTNADQEAVKQGFCQNIGVQASSAVLDLIQRKITKPIVSSTVQYAVDKGLEEYQRQQRELLEVYSKAASDNMQPANGAEQLAKSAIDNYHIDSNLSSNELILAMQTQNMAAHNGAVIEVLAAKLKQPIYLFSDGKLDKVYGKGQNGKAITIGYDQQNKQYTDLSFNLTGKKYGSEPSIYQAIASQIKGKYNASQLLQMNYSSEIVPTVKATDKPVIKPSSSNNLVFKPEGGSLPAGKLGLSDEGGSGGNQWHESASNQAHEDPFDAQLQKSIKKFVQDKPEYADEIKQIGYADLKDQMIKVLVASHNKPAERSLLGKIGDGFKELFGISEAQAASAVAPLLTNPAVLTAATTIARKIVEYGGPPLLAALASYEISSQYNALKEAQADFQRKKYEDRNKPITQTQHKPQTSSFMPDPGDFEPDDGDDKDKQNSFDPSEKGNYDKVSRDNKFGKFYRDAKDSKTWYSKERSGDRAHGGEHWKKFRQIGEDLVHEADVDMAGNIMRKHKGKTGKVIDKNNLIGIK